MSHSHNDVITLVRIEIAALHIKIAHQYLSVTQLNIYFFSFSDLLFDISQAVKESEQVMSMQNRTCICYGSIS